MGQSSADISSQVDTNAHLLCYPSMPLVKTMTLNWLRAEQYSAGTMLRSLIACYDGFNQEDAITLNQKSIDLGLFRSYQTSCVTLQEKKRGSMNTVERFGKPSRFTTLGMKSGSYEQLDRDGFLFPGTPVNNDDVLIGRMLPINKTSPTADVHIAKLDVSGEGEGANSIEYDKMGFMCTSIMASQKTSGIVLDTIVTSDIHGMKKVKLKILKTCFAAGTPVALSNGTSVPIEQVRVGDHVLARHQVGDQHGLAPRAVTAVLDQGERECVELLFDDGRKVTCTPDHRILTADGHWVEAGALIIGETEVAAVAAAAAECSLNTLTSCVLPLIHVKLVGRLSVGVKHVYDLAVPSGNDDYDSFTANGLLVHNCTFILGDKASSRHGQKGVMGVSRPSKEFPFTAQNHIPDLVRGRLGPHAHVQLSRTS